MKVIGLNKIIEESFQNDIGSAINIDKMKRTNIGKRGYFYVGDIGDLWKLQKLEIEEVNAILETNMSIFSFDLNIIYLKKTHNIKDIIYKIIQLNVKHSIIIIYILLYSLVFDTSYTNDDNKTKQKQNYDMIYEIIKDIFEHRPAEPAGNKRNLRLVLLESINSRNRTDIYVNTVITYMEIMSIFSRKVKPENIDAEEIRTKLINLCDVNGYISFKDYNVFIIMMNILINLVESDIKIDPNVLEYILDTLYDEQMIDTSSYTHTVRLTIHLITSLIKKDYMNTALKFITRINSFIITKLIKTLPKEQLYKTVRNQTLYKHLQYLAIIKGEDQKYIKRTSNESNRT